MDSRRTSGHSTAWPGCGFSQLRSQAFHASWSASAPKPGRSDQRTGTHRLLPRVKAGSGSAESAGAVAGAGTVREGVPGSGGSGTEPHATSIPTMTAKLRNRTMLLILLEALGALLLLVLIVWWTMFSGRKGGEPPRDEPPDAGPR
jgi:hypothetical protein